MCAKLSPFSFLSEDEESCKLTYDNLLFSNEKKIATIASVWYQALVEDSIYGKKLLFQLTLDLTGSSSILESSSVNCEDWENEIMAIYLQRDSSLQQKYLFLQRGSATNSIEFFISQIIEHGFDMEFLTGLLKPYVAFLDALSKSGISEYEIVSAFIATSIICYSMQAIIIRKTTDEIDAFMYDEIVEPLCNVATYAFSFMDSIKLVVASLCNLMSAHHSSIINCDAIMELYALGLMRKNIPAVRNILHNICEMLDGENKNISDKFRLEFSKFINRRLASWLRHYALAKMNIVTDLAFSVLIRLSRLDCPVNLSSVEFDNLFIVMVRDEYILKTRQLAGTLFFEYHGSIKNNVIIKLMEFFTKFQKNDDNLALFVESLLPNLKSVWDELFIMDTTELGVRIIINLCKLIKYDVDNYDTCVIEYLRKMPTLLKNNECEFIQSGLIESLLHIEMLLYEPKYSNDDRYVTNLVSELYEIMTNSKFIHTIRHAHAAYKKLHDAGFIAVEMFLKMHILDIHGSVINILDKYADFKASGDNLHAPDIPRFEQLLCQLMVFMQSHKLMQYLDEEQIMQIFICIQDQYFGNEKCIIYQMHIHKTIIFILKNSLNDNLKNIDEEYLALACNSLQTNIKSFMDYLKEELDENSSETVKYEIFGALCEMLVAVTPSFAENICVEPVKKNTYVSMGNTLNAMVFDETCSVDLQHMKKYLKLWICLHEFQVIPFSAVANRCLLNVELRPQLKVEFEELVRILIKKDRLACSIAFIIFSQQHKNNVHLPRFVKSIKELIAKQLIKNIPVSKEYCEIIRNILSMYCTMTAVMFTTGLNYLDALRFVRPLIPALTRCDLIEVQNAGKVALQKSGAKSEERKSIDQFIALTKKL